ncbi:MAG: serine/threonine protein kinase, partial [Chloroflexota bacterium]|nr:serine/threonine protein kinase [Chloroflexota bacterium]
MPEKMPVRAGAARSPEPVVGEVGAAAADGLVLGRYRLIELLARGGSADVWRGHDLRLARPVAIKLLHGHLLPDERSRRRLAAEARAVASLSHRSIVRVYDVDVVGERPAIILELVEGGTLAQRLERDGRIPARDAARIGADLADALFHAHKRGIVHRDLKPANVLLDAAGRAKLADFGIARLLGEAADRMTMTGTVIGTLRYMAPEQLAGDSVGPRADLFSLGVMLHEALAGQPPFPASTPLALAEQQAAGTPPLADVDPGLAAIVAAALAPDLAHRPRHAGEMAGALRAWLDGRTLPTTMTARVSSIVPALGRRRGPTESRAERRRSGLPAWAAAALLVALVAGVFGFTALGGASPDGQQ